MHKNATPLDAAFFVCIKNNFLKKLSFFFRNKCNQNKRFMLLLLKDKRPPFFIRTPFSSSSGCWGLFFLQSVARLNYLYTTFLHKYNIRHVCIGIVYFGCRIKHGRICSFNLQGTGCCEESFYQGNVHCRRLVRRISGFDAIFRLDSRLKI